MKIIRKLYLNNKSIVIGLPKQLIGYHDYKVGDELEVIVEKNKIILRKVKKCYI